MSKKNAVMLILLGGTFMSFVGLYMRLLTDANGFQILFYRSLSLCAIVGLVSCCGCSSCDGCGGCACGSRACGRVWVGVRYGFAYDFVEHTSAAVLRW